MILNQGALGLGDRLLDSMELLRDVGAGALRLDHPDHTEKMPIGTFQPFDDIGVGCMGRVFYHRKTVSPPGG